MTTTDCLIIGFNDFSFERYAEMIHAMGEDSGAWRDLSLALLRLDGRPLHSMDVLNRFHSEGSPVPARRFHNADFLWPVVMTLGSYLHRRGLSFDYVNLFQEEKEALREKLLAGDVLTIAITTTLYVSPHPILEIISFIRRYNQSARIVVGGPYIGNQPRQGEAEDLKRLFQYLGADYYVMSSEGEASLAHLIQVLKTGGPIDSVPNLGYRQGDSYALTPAQTESNPLEENPICYELFQKDIGQFLSIRTAKSCPFSCAFCGFPQRAGRYKYLSVADVEKELDRVQALGTVTTLTFLDDTFNLPPKRYRELLQMMIRNRYSFRWNAFYRSDHGDDEIIELMAQAGCEGVFLGIESGSDVLLKKMNKTARRADYMKAIPKLREQGILTYASLIVGFPGETTETIAETVSLIETAQPDFFRAQLWYCDPITPIWEKREQYGIQGSGFQWSHATMDSAQACDHIDRMFLGISGSIWLPQTGFEQWSTYYLQRQGMSVGRLKEFLRCFNAGVKERLLYQDRKPLGGELLQSLRTSCRFEDAPLDMGPVAALSGERYRAAEAYLAGTLDPASERSGSAQEAHAQPLALSEQLVDASLLQAACRATLLPARELLLSALGVLLLRLTGQREQSLLALTALGGVPLRLRPRWEQPFGAFAQAVHAAHAEAAPHAAFALPITLNPLRLAALGRACPDLSAGFLYRASAADPELADLLQLYPALAGQLPLVAEVSEESGAAGCTVRLWARSGLYDPADRAQLLRSLEHLLQAIATDADAAIAALPLDAAAPGAVLPETTSELSATFDF